MKALYQHCIFRSDERVESHARIATELADHRLEWHGDRIDTRLFKFDTPRVSLYSLHYGAEVSIFPDLYEQFSLVHFSLFGRIEIKADRQRQVIEQGKAIVSTPNFDVNLTYAENSEQLILRMPHSLLRETAYSMGRPMLYHALRQNPGLLLSEHSSECWQAQLQAFVTLEDGIRRNKTFLPWLAHMEQSMAMFLLLQGQEQGEQSGSGQMQSVRYTHDRRRLDRLYEYALARLGQPVTLIDLAKAAALSERQLNTFCHTHLGQSPMAWLRDLRLDAVHAAIQADPESDLTDIAMRHGFFHLGRFSAAYRDRFDELPSQTRKTAKNG
ncbi:MAG: AraC family transcriptional regulator [Chromatiales bacterium]|nr:AraC family transcriptional regulator [Chromatiales bacterium]